MDYGPICGLVLWRTTSPPLKLELLSESDEQMQIQAKIGDTVYVPGEKPGNSYPYLEPDDNFGTGSRYPVLATNH